MNDNDAYHNNYVLNHQSDIFNQKDLSRREVPYSQKAHISNISNQTTSNFITWDDSNDRANLTIPNNTSRKKFIISRPTMKLKHKKLEEKLYSVDDVPNNTNGNQKNKETLFMGNYDGDEYKIKKEKNKEYNPNIYFKTKKPAQIKIEQFYGNLRRRNKPAIQRTKTEEKQYNTISNNPREMKYINIYGRNGIENANKKLESLSFNNSTNNVYNPEFDPKQNRVNMLLSNIFNDNKIEKRNREHSQKKNNDYNKLNNNANNNDNQVIKVKIKNKKINKKAKFDKNAEKLPGNLDWRDIRINLLFSAERDKEVSKKDARTRKFNEIYGSEPSKPKEKVEDNFNYNNRDLIEQATKSLYNDLNEAKIKKISENISQMQGNEFVNNSSIYKDKNNKNDEIKTFEVNNSQINEKEIEKAFADKGIHIYEIKEKDTSVTGNIKDNKIVFKIRENKNDKDFNKKIKDIKRDFKNNKKVDIKTSLPIKKKNVDLLPSSLKWNTTNGHLYTKNRNVEKTLQEKTHSKPLENKNNEDQKVTKIFVNLRYKNRMNLP